MRWADMTRAERYQAVRKLTDGRTATAIAAQLGTTRNAIIGIWKRVRDAGGDWAPRHVRRPKRERAAKEPADREPWKITARRLPETTRSGKVPQNAVAIKRRDAWQPIRESRPINVKDMPLCGRCRWPVDGVDGTGVIQCGASCPPDSVYCHRHTRLAERTAA